MSNTCNKCNHACHCDVEECTTCESDENVVNCPICDCDGRHEEE